MKFAFLTIGFIIFYLLCTPFTVNAADGTKNGIAVWELEDLTNGLSGESSEVLTSQIIEVLSRSNRYVTIERVHLQRLLEEQKLGTSALVDSKTALKLGQLIGARMMVFGSYLILGPISRVDIRLVEVETGVVIKAFKKEGNSANMQGGLNGTVVELAESLLLFIDSSS